MSRIWPTTLAVLTTIAATALLGVPAHAGKATPPVLAFTASPSPDYGEVAVGDSRERTFTLTNTGSTGSAAIKVSLTPTGVFTIPAGGDRCTGVALGKQKTCTVTVRYTPTGAGAADTVTLTASAKKPATPATLTLSGTSPSGLSAGCADIASNGYLDDYAAIKVLAAGEEVTLTALSGASTSTIEITWATPANELGSTEPVTVGETTTFVVPKDSMYALGLSKSYQSGTQPIDSWVWSCSAGS
jgi:hypothetical protein